MEEPGKVRLAADASGPSRERRPLPRFRERPSEAPPRQRRPQPPSAATSRRTRTAPRRRGRISDVEPGFEDRAAIVVRPKTGARRPTARRSAGGATDDAAPCRQSAAARQCAPAAPAQHASRAGCASRSSPRAEIRTAELGGDGPRPSHGARSRRRGGARRRTNQVGSPSWLPVEMDLCASVSTASGCGSEFYRPARLQLDEGSIPGRRGSSIFRRPSARSIGGLGQHCEGQGFCEMPLQICFRQPRRHSRNVPILSINPTVFGGMESQRCNAAYSLHACRAPRADKPGRRPGSARGP